MPYSSDDLSLEDAIRLDALCMRFEGELRTSGPRMETFLAEVGPELRSPLLAELLALDIEVRAQCESSLRLSDYLDRFPSESKLVQDVYAESFACRPARCRREAVEDCGGQRGACCTLSTHPRNRSRRPGRRVAGRG